MKAMIFAAGLGTRLKPLTDRMPKALVPVGGKPLLQIVVEKLAAAGFSEIVVNVHHFPEMIREFAEQHHHFGVTLHISDESEAILDTGGGLMKAADLLLGDTPVLIHNVDILSDLDLQKLIAHHQASGALATVVVRERHTQRYLLFDEELRLAGWTNRATGEVRTTRPEAVKNARVLAFSGIQVIDPKIFSLITQRGKFSIIDTYLELAAHWPVMGYWDRSPLWMDVGKPEQLELAGKLFSSSQNH